MELIALVLVLAVPLGVLASAALLGLLAWWYREPPDDRCWSCGYPKQGTRATRCPECGVLWDEAASTTRWGAGAMKLVVPAAMFLPPLIAVAVVVFTLFYLVIHFALWQS